MDGGVEIASEAGLVAGQSVTLLQQRMSVTYAMAHELSQTTPLAALMTLLDVNEATLKSHRRSEGPVEETVLDTSDT